jgi:hypothetical protein
MNQIREVLAAASRKQKSQYIRGKESLCPGKTGNVSPAKKQRVPGDAGRLIGGGRGDTSRVGVQPRSSGEGILICRTVAIVL